jgi:hypothetical protein
MTDCSICLTPLGEAPHALRCGHAFHSDCLVPWLLTAPQRVCPNCRDCYEDDDSSDDEVDVAELSVPHSAEAPFWTHRACSTRPHLRAWLLASLRRRSTARRAPRSLKTAFATLGRRKERERAREAREREVRRSARGTLAELRAELRREERAKSAAVEARLDYEDEIVSRCRRDVAWRAFLADKLSPPPWLHLSAPR